MRPTPDCPDPEEAHLASIVRARPRPKCDPPPPVLVPDFRPPLPPGTAIPAVLIPLPYELANGEVTLDCSWFPAYLADPLPAQNIPIGDPVVVAASTFTEKFFWNASGLTPLELRNIAVAQQTYDVSIPLAAADTAYFVSIGVSPAGATAITDLWATIVNSLTDQATASALFQLRCEWESPELTYNCPAALAGTTLITPTFTSAAGRFVSEISEQDAIDRAQAYLDSISVCIYENEEVLVECTSPTEGNPVTIPAGEYESEDSQEILDLIAALSLTLVDCAYPNAELTYTCTDHVVDPTGLAASNVPVVIAAGTYYGITQLEADAQALAAAQAEISCKFEATAEVNCCCFEEKEGIPFDDSAPKDDLCAPDALGSPELELTCPPVTGTCLFMRSGSDPELCNRLIGSTPPSVSVLAESFIDKADALAQAYLQAVAELVCDHTNEEIITEECPPGLVAVAPITIPPGTVTATNMTEANSIARVYAAALIECRPRLFTATAKALCCPFPDGRAASETCENPKSEALYRKSLRPVYALLSDSMEVPDPDFPEFPPVLDPVQEFSGGKLWKVTPQCTAWDEPGFAGALPFADFDIKTGQGESTISEDDALRQAEAEAVAQLNCEHTNAEVTADCCPDVHDPVTVAAGTMNATSTLEANVLAEIFAEAQVFCCWSAAVTLECCPFGARAGVTDENPWGTPGFISGKVARYVKETLMTSCDLGPPGAPAADTGACTSWGDGAIFADPTSIVSTGYGESTTSAAEAEALATADALASLDCDHTNNAIFDAWCPTGRNLVEAGDVPGNIVRAPSTEEADRIARSMAIALKICDPSELFPKAPSCPLSATYEDQDDEDDQMISISGGTIDGPTPAIQVAVQGVRIPQGDWHINVAVANNTPVQGVIVAGLPPGGRRVDVAPGGDQFGAYYVGNEKGCGNLKFERGFYDGYLVWFITA